MRGKLQGAVRRNFYPALRAKRDSCGAARRPARRSFNAGGGQPVPLGYFQTDTASKDFTRSCPPRYARRLIYIVFDTLNYEMHKIAPKPFRNSGCDIIALLNMKNQSYIFRGFINAAGVFVYVSAVAWLMFNGKNIFGKSPNFLMPLFILLLFIMSATITSLLVLGKPIQLYLGGSKKEAVNLLFTTLACLALFAVIVILVILLI